RPTSTRTSRATATTTAPPSCTASRDSAATPGRRRAPPTSTAPRSSTATRRRTPVWTARSPSRAEAARAGLAVLALAAAACASEQLGQYAPTPDVGTRVDRFLQVAQIDVLLVVDDSASMADEQALLGQNFGRFIDRIDPFGLDYHIGIVTTDVDNPAESG